MLRKITARKVEEVAQRKQEVSQAELERIIMDQAPCRSMKARFTGRTRPMGVIAEVKKASPSKGLIRPDFDPLAIAGSYIAAEVEAISVLTDEDFFQGHLSYLRRIREEVAHATPLLRKDFLIDPYQLYEARANGADAILLIAAILTRDELMAMAAEAHALGMEALVEVHTAEELDTVLGAIEPDLLGINNRDLRTFTTSLVTTFTLLDTIPDSVVTISESGIYAPEQIAELATSGVDGVLVGEHFMRKQNVTEAVIELVGRTESRVEAGGQ